MTPTYPRRRLWPLLLFACLFASLALATPALAARALLSQAALATSSTPPLVPPPEGEIEGACGLAIKPDGGIYVSDYYHRVIDVYAPFGGQPATYQSQIPLPGTNPVFGTIKLDAVCGLALDADGNLYANEFHQRVLRISGGETTIDTGESTGLAIDPSTNRLYVDDRTYVAEYALPFTAEDEPLAIIATDPGADYYGLAASGGRVYVADAASQTVKVFDAASENAGPLATIGAGFKSLVDSSLAIDPTNGHLLVVDNTQPLFEHPKSSVHEFAAAPGYADLGTLPGAPIFGAPSGIAVTPTGTVLVTDGNSELANVFAYGPYQEGFAPLAPASPAAAATSAAGAPPGPSALAPAPATTATRTTRKGHRNRRHRNRHHHRAGERR